MARRRQSSTADDLIELVALLPWWAGAGLAIGSYLALHALAAVPLLPAKSPQDLGSMVTGSIWRTFASFGQYLLPFLFSLGALASALRRQRRRQLMQRATQANEIAAELHALSWQQFEMLIGEGFRRQGFNVVETGGGGADGGVDLVMRRRGEQFLVQCKHWRATKVGVTTVRELFGVMTARGATGAYVVTAGEFTDDAKAFAAGRNIELVSGRALTTLLRAGQQADDAVLRQSTVPQVSPASSEKAGTAARKPIGHHDDAQGCPSCGSAMVRRVARRGTSVGQAFWGCSTYPACTGTRAIPVTK